MVNAVFILCILFVNIMMFDVNTSFEILVGQCFKKSLLACLKLLLLGGLFMSFISHDKA